MALLGEHDSNSGDTELLVYAMSLVNKVLNGIPDIDTYYDQVDALEEQGMATIIQRLVRKFKNRFFLSVCNLRYQRDTWDIFSKFL